jgi:hypothetical protein
MIKISRQLKAIKTSENEEDPDDGEGVKFSPQDVKDCEIISQAVESALRAYIIGENKRVREGFNVNLNIKGSKSGEISLSLS